MEQRIFAQHTNTHTYLYLHICTIQKYAHFFIPLNYSWVSNSNTELINTNQILTHVSLTLRSLTKGKLKNSRVYERENKHIIVDATHQKQRHRRKVFLLLLLLLRPVFFLPPPAHLRFTMTEYPSTLYRWLVMYTKHSSDAMIVERLWPE